MNDISPNNPLFHPLLVASRADSRIETVVVFGSYVRQAQYRDIDICLVMGDTVDKTHVLLEYIRHFGDPFDIKEFSLLPLYIRARVMKEGKILLVKDEDRLIRLYLKTLKEYDLFQPHFQTYLETIQNG